VRPKEYKLDKKEEDIYKKEAIRKIVKKSCK
jgi:hypothetical protein